MEGGIEADDVRLVGQGALELLQQLECRAVVERSKWGGAAELGAHLLRGELGLPQPRPTVYEAVADRVERNLPGGGHQLLRGRPRREIP
jgi:hypothetical protein